MFGYLPREKFGFTKFLDPMLLHLERVLGLRKMEILQASSGKQNFAVFHTLEPAVKGMVTRNIKERVTFSNP